MDALLEVASGPSEIAMDHEESSSAAQQTESLDPVEQLSSLSKISADINTSESEEGSSRKKPRNDSGETDDVASSNLVEEIEVDLIAYEKLMEVDETKSKTDAAGVEASSVTEEVAAETDTVSSDASKDVSISVSGSDTRKAEAFSNLQSILASAKKKITISDQVGGSTKSQNSANASLKSGSVANSPVIIDLEKENSEQHSNPQSGKSSITAKQAPKSKPPTILSRKVLLPNSTSSVGKLMNIQILNKDQGAGKNVSNSPSPSTTPMKSPTKKMPLLLPKPTESSPGLQKIVVPKNFVLVQTEKGLVLMRSDGVPEGAVRATTAQSNRVINFTKHVSVSNTPIAKSVGITNSPMISKSTWGAPKTTSASHGNASATPLSSLKMSPLVFSSTSGGTISDGTGLKMRVTTAKVYKSKPLLQPLEPTRKELLKVTDGCAHPVCTQYRERIMEELRTKIRTRDRKLKSTRMGKERSVKRAARELQTVKDLERQKSLYVELESFPESLCKNLIRFQLRPNEGVRAKRQYQEVVNGFARRLHSISPKAYDIVKDVFNKVLPEAKSIDSWSFGETEIPVPENSQPEKAVNSGEDAGSDSDSEGDDEMGEEGS